MSPAIAMHTIVITSSSGGLIACYMAFHQQHMKQAKSILMAASLVACLVYCEPVVSVLLPQAYLGGTPICIKDLTKYTTTHVNKSLHGATVWCTCTS